MIDFCSQESKPLLLVEATIYNMIDEAPGYFGRRHYHPGGYIIYGERLLTFRGELIVFVPK